MTLRGSLNVLGRRRPSWGEPAQLGPGIPGSPHNSPVSPSLHFLSLPPDRNSSASLPHPLAPCLILNPREKTAQQPPCYRSSGPVAFIIPVPSCSFLWPSILLCCKPPPQGGGGGSCQQPDSLAGMHRDVAMPQEWKPVALWHGTWEQVTCGQPA